MIGLDKAQVRFGRRVIFSGLSFSVAAGSSDATGAGSAARGPELSAVARPTPTIVVSASESHNANQSHRIGLMLPVTA